MEVTWTCATLAAEVTPCVVLLSAHQPLDLILLPLPCEMWHQDTLASLLHLSIVSVLFVK
jgi:hypothetical protein